MAIRVVIRPTEGYEEAVAGRADALLAGINGAQRGARRGAETVPPPLGRISNSRLLQSRQMPLPIRLPCGAPQIEQQSGLRAPSEAARSS